MVRILVIDDEVDFIKLAHSMLKKEGYEVESALTGEEGLAKLEGSKADLILLDLMMPGMHGFEVCKRLEANPKTRDIPIIVITVKGDFESIERAYKHPAVKNYIAKPFEKKNLLKMIRAVLESGHAPKPRKTRPPRLKERVYKAIIERYPEGMMILDNENRVLKVNNTFEAMTGYSKEEFIGRWDFPDIIKPQNEKGHILLLSEAFKACFCDDPTSTAIFNITNKSGVKIKVVSTVFKPDPEITVVIFRNISR